MDRNFKSFKEFNDFVKMRMDFTSNERKEVVHEALTETAIFLQKKVKEKFGEYQSGWEELTAATQEDRVRKGYSPNDPLLRSGELRDSVERNVSNTSASVGTNNPIMIYQEKGTTRTGWSGAKGIPPRPVFLITHQENGAEAVSIFAETLLQLIRREL